MGQESKDGNMDDFDWAFLESSDGWTSSEADDSESASPERPSSYSDWVVSGSVCREAAPASTAASLSAGAQPGRPSAPGITDTGTSKRWTALGGLDWLEGSINGVFGEGYAEFCKELTAAQEAARSQAEGRAIPVYGATLVVGERGLRWGNTFFPWVVRWNGIEICFGRPGQSEKCFVAKFRISSLTLTRYGYRESWAMVQQLLQACHVGIREAVWFRADVCVDLADQEVAPFCEAISDDRVVTRLKSEKSFYKRADGTWNGCSMGKSSSCRVSVYDKLYELERAKNKVLAEAKRYALIQRRWGYVPFKATRVEFQMRGSWAREKWANCRTVEQLFDLLDKIARYLVEQFFRIVDEVDRANLNQSKARVSNVWREVVSACADWTENFDCELERAERKAPLDRTAPAKRLVGAALGYLATMPLDVPDRQSLFNYVLWALDRHLGPEQFWKGKLRRKSEELIASGVMSMLDMGAADELAMGRFSGFRVEYDFFWSGDQLEEVAEF